MFALLQFILGLISIEPEPASMIAANIVGKPELADELHVVCKRESKCSRVGIHDGDRWAGKTMYRKAMQVGWLDAWCPWHANTDDPERFSVRGSFGLSAAYSLRFLAPCLPPEVLDIPVVSAYAAAKRMLSQCEKHGACERKGYRRYWVGAKRYDRRLKRLQEQKEAEQSAASDLAHGPKVVASAHSNASSEKL
jgi:hypothetical protein